MWERRPGGASGGTEDVATVERQAQPGADGGGVATEPRPPEASPQPMRQAPDAPPRDWQPAGWRGPSRWKRRLTRGLLALIVLVLIGGAVATVLVQRGADDRGSEAVAAAAPQASAPVRQALRGLSLPQKVDAVMVAGVADIAAAEAQLRKGQLGGVGIGPEAWAEGGSAGIARLRSAATAGGRIAPLIVAAQEGGSYRAYRDLPPAARELEIGEIADPALAERSARQAASALKRAGFDLNLAPVADVATIDSPIADRAYSDDPALVASLVAAALRGCQKGGLACAPSHFPGLGGASADTAQGPATVSLDSASLQERDVAPFAAAFEAGAPAVVLSLALYAAYDPVTPGALSPAIATDLLRGELGYEGVAITDDLSGGAVAAGIGAPEAAVQALRAGSDMVVVSDPAQAAQARQAVLDAASSAALSRARLDEAVARVLTLKRRLGLLPG